MSERPDHPDPITPEPPDPTLQAILKRLDALAEEVGELRVHKDAELHEVRYEIKALLDKISGAEALNWLRAAAEALAAGAKDFNEDFSFIRNT